MIIIIFIICYMSCWSPQHPVSSRGQLISERFYGVHLRGLEVRGPKTLPLFIVYYQTPWAEVLN